jgi:hypothetical protein
LLLSFKATINLVSGHEVSGYIAGEREIERDRERKREMWFCVKK